MEHQLKMGDIEPCVGPDGTEFEAHDFRREMRVSPASPDLAQDRMACPQCGGVLYAWATIARGRAG